MIHTLSQAEAEHANALKVGGGDLTDVSTLLIKISTSCKLVAA